MKLKEHFGGKLPQIEDVRIEIGIPRTKREVFPSEETKVEPLVFPEIKVDSVKASVTQKEYIMALKIFKLGKHFETFEERYAIPDLVKSICDLYSCSKEYDGRLMLKHLADISKLNDVSSSQILSEAGKRIRKLAVSKDALSWFATSGQTSFMARTLKLKNLIGQVIELVRFG